MPPSLPPQLTRRQIRCSPASNMFYSALLVAGTAFTGLVHAQNYSMTNISVVPDSVDYDTRLSWCQAQHNSCPVLCGGVPDTANNTCDAVSTDPSHCC